jgi:hypothetical protein
VYGWRPSLKIMLHVCRTYADPERRRRIFQAKKVARYIFVIVGSPRELRRYSSELKSLPLFTQPAGFI